MLLTTTDLPITQYISSWCFGGDIIEIIDSHVQGDFL